MEENPLNKIDVKELELPETVCIRDIESKVFQSIVVNTLAKIEGVDLLEGNFIDNLLGRDNLDRARGVFVEQDLKNHSVSIKVELNVAYGLSIPKVAEEVQTKIVEEISEYTGLHVSCVHVIFKNLIPARSTTMTQDAKGTLQKNEKEETQEEFSRFF